MYYTLVLSSLTYTHIYTRLYINISFDEGIISLINIYFVNLLINKSTIYINWNGSLLANNFIKGY